MRFNPATVGCDSRAAAAPCLKAEQRRLYFVARFRRRNMFAETRKPPLFSLPTNQSAMLISPELFRLDVARRQWVPAFHCPIEHPHPLDDVRRISPIDAAIKPRPPSISLIGRSYARQAFGVGSSYRSCQEPAHVRTGPRLPVGQPARPFAARR